MFVNVPGTKVYLVVRVANDHVRVFLVQHRMMIETYIAEISGHVLTGDICLGLLLAVHLRGHGDDVLVVLVHYFLDSGQRFLVVNHHFPSLLFKQLNLGMRPIIIGLLLLQKFLPCLRGQVLIFKLSLDKGSSGLLLLLLLQVGEIPFSVSCHSDAETWHLDLDQGS